MTDIADKAAELTSLDLNLALQKRRPSLQPRGACYNCDEPLADDRRFCDAECRDDYEKRQRFAQNY